MKDILIWDQILVGTNCENIREEALKNQWNLDDLLWKGRKTESEIQAASQIKTEYKYNVKRVKDCEYSKHSKNKRNLHHKTQNLFVGNVRTKAAQVTTNINITKTNAENAKIFGIPLKHVIVIQAQIKVTVFSRPTLFFPQGPLLSHSIKVMKVYRF